MKEGNPFCLSSTQNILESICDKEGADKYEITSVLGKHSLMQRITMKT
jgi:hypothetical protein